MGFRERHRIPDLGVGVGARPRHYPDIFGERDDAPAGDPLSEIDWFEVISENFMLEGGRPLSNLSKLLDRRPVVLHGVSLSIGSSRPLDRDYLKELRVLAERVRPAWFTDHLCWTGTASSQLHDLLPLPFTKENLHYIADRIRCVQDFVGLPFGIENASSYMTFVSDGMPEDEFVAELAHRADCGVLLDCNNVYVSAQNHGFDAERYIDTVAGDRVIQMHLAGHTDKGKYLLDTHSDKVSDPVWALYRRALGRTGAVSTLIEWDEDIPPWATLAAEASLARKVRREVLGATPPRREVATSLGGER